MNCEELREHYDLYALDIAEEPERSEIRAHLGRGCEVCMAGVKHALETGVLVGSTATAANPPARLRRRILASVGSEARGGWMLAWAGALAMAALAGIAVYFIASSRQYAAEAVRLAGQLATQRSEIARLTEAFAILSGPQTTEVSFGGQPTQPPRGKVFVNPGRGVVLIASNLPATPADKIYEMWFIPRSVGAQAAPPVPAGLFRSQEDGNALHVRPGEVNVASTAAIAVTVEDAAGANQPTTTPLIVAPLAPPAP